MNATPAENVQMNGKCHCQRCGHNKCCSRVGAALLRGPNGRVDLGGAYPLFCLCSSCKACGACNLRKRPHTSHLHDGEGDAGDRGRWRPVASPASAMEGQAWASKQCSASRCRRCLRLMNSSGSSNVSLRFSSICSVYKGHCPMHQATKRTIAKEANAMAGPGESLR